MPAPDPDTPEAFFLEKVYALRDALNNPDSNDEALIRAFSLVIEDPHFNSAMVREYISLDKILGISLPLKTKILNIPAYSPAIGFAIEGIFKIWFSDDDDVGVWVQPGDSSIDSAIRAGILPPHIGVLLGKAAAKALSKNPYLKTFEMTYIPIGEEGGIAIANALKINNRLTGLYLINTFIGDKGLAAIESSIKNNSPLTILRLETNHFTSSSGATIARILSKCPNLIYLNLGKNNLQDKGVKDIVDQVKHHVKINTFYISANNITDMGAKEIAETITENNSLTAISFSENQISSKGGIILANAIRHKTLLQHIFLSYNYISISSIYEILHILEPNIFILELHLHGTYGTFSAEPYDFEKISKFTDRNKRLLNSKIKKLNAIFNKRETDVPSTLIILHSLSHLKVVEPFIEKLINLLLKNLAINPYMPNAQHYRHTIRLYLLVTISLLNDNNLRQSYLGIVIPNKGAYQTDFKLDEPVTASVRQICDSLGMDAPQTLSRLSPP